MNIVPVISIVGRSESGKTSLIEKLVPELKRRGYRIATLKHAQEVEIVTGKDDSRHLEAGAELAGVVTEHESFFRKRAPQAGALEDALRLIGNDYDLVLCEGFKKSSNPKVLVHRAGNGPPPEGLTSVVAVVTDEPLDTRLRRFSSSDTKGLADLIEEGFIKPQGDNLTLYVNGKKVPLIMFPRVMFHRAILGMVSALKGVGEVRSLTVYLRNKRAGGRTEEAMSISGEECRY